MTPIIRIKQSKDLIKLHELDALFVSSVDNIGYLTSFFHFSPIEREAFVLVTKHNTYLFTDSRYTGMVTQLPHISLIEAAAHTPAFDQIKKIADKQNLSHIGFDPANMTVQEYTSLKKILGTTHNLKPLADLVTQQRVIKDTQEIKQIKKACSLSDHAFRYLLPFIRVGVTEKELAERITNFFKRNDANNAFSPIVAFGTNAAIPHHVTSNKPLTLTDKYILFDFGAKYKNYCADMSRTIFMGDIPDEIRKQYATVLTAQKKAFAALKDMARTTKSVDSAARDYLQSNSYSLPHALGHGVGIAVHEQPVLSPRQDVKLATNMVLAIEPGIYLPGLGGIRIEDTVLVTEKGYQVLTKAPKELMVISS